MSKKSKKVILFLVEGVSEENALGLPMKNHFETSETRFDVLHGDITTKSGFDSRNILKQVNQIVSSYMDRYGYKPSDIIRIVHIIDTDGAFIPDDAIVFDENVSLGYTENRIVTRDPAHIKVRNENKSKTLYKLFNTYFINRIKYNVYYNSCNLEHVLVGELRDFDNIEKEKIADDFSNKYCDDMEGFKLFLLSVLPKEEYKESWKFIREGINSLKRFSNMSLILNED